MSITTQLIIFLISCLLAVILVLGGVFPFIEAHPQVILPGAIGGSLGFIGSIFLMSVLEPEMIWDFLIIISLPSWVGIALGFMVGLALEG